MTTARLPDAPWRHRPGFDDLCARLGAAEGETRLVGGAVRDGLLGLDVADIDLATRLRPDEVTQRLTGAGIKVVPTGITHGTVTAVLDHRPVEITTLRSDVSTDGRRATIVYTDDWQEDAARRDFTINALYADPATGDVSDYFGGLKDLEARRVRFIGDPAQRIAEDHLRILRYFRFLARFGALPPDAAAYAACRDNANSLMALSRERIADELLKLLALPDPSAVLRLMIEGGVLLPVLPEIEAAGLARLEALIARQQQAGLDMPPAAVLRLCALLPPDADVGEQIAARLKLSNKARKRIVTALTPPPAHASAQELVYRVGTEAALDLMLLDRAEASRNIGPLSHWNPPVFPLSGRDIIALGISAGPDVAKLLSTSKEQWIAEGFPDANRARAIAQAQVAEFLRSRQNS
ncbi:CCA tRNA nucleotidyltransferase [Sphingobium sp. DEHP117]|uniref:CCA tRNA nucleotidyltransferase n=1 Tax=Sphingobium sp. DEHP117 TaxID=2993436 RepID=UPI0027D55FB9|nr:CCA tRNA nucleotidyltransferase [Sphingobium sp. DEHP117]MDQ4418857.1 CCA tRNA nucleotidyltransferase [Sphingobium sp. DEHP117]